MPRITAETLTAFALDLLAAVDVERSDAEAVVAHLVDANLCGHDSHGVVRLPWYVRQLGEGELVRGVSLKVLRESPATLVCDAQLGFGQVQMLRLAERLVEKSQSVGVACGTLRDSGHIGRLGAYAEWAAERGLAALLTVNDNGVFRVVAPPGGREPRISTNPISIGVPTPEGPLVYDASTSVVAQGKVLLRRLNDEPCPPGWLQDAEGRPTTDPHVLQANPPGSLLSLGGYKGFGLAVMLDLLVGGLSGGFCPPPQAGALMCNTVLLVLWNPDHFGGREHLLEQAGLLIDSIRECPLAEGAEPIRLPGDSSRATRIERRRDGIPLAEGTWQALLKLAARQQVAPPQVD